MKKSLLLFTTVAGVATLLSAGVAVAQELYVTDQTADQLTVIPLGGGPIQTIMNPMSGGFLNAPTGIAIDTDAGTYQGDVFVANAGNGTAGNGSISIYNPTTASFIGNLATGLTNPEGIAFDSNGNLYVTSDVAGGSITKFSGPSLGTQTPNYATGLTNPYGVASTKGGTLYVTQTGGGGGLATISSLGGTAAPFPISFSGTPPTGSEGVVFGPTDDLYVVYANGGSPTLGQITLGQNGTIATGSLGSNTTIPLGLVFNNGNPQTLYVADFGSNVVTVYSQTSNVGGQVTYSPTGVTYGTSAGPTFLAFDPLATQSVPEPGTYAMLLGGLAALYFLQRRRTAAVAKI